MPINRNIDGKCNDIKDKNYSEGGGLSDISSAGGGSLGCNPVKK